MQHRHKRVGELEDRALINLPFPIPSIPILDPILKPLAPILTPLIDGTHPQTKTTSTTTTPHTTSTTPTQAPAPTANPTTQASNPTAPSSGGGNSSGNNSGNSGSDPAGNSGSSPSSGSSGGSSTNNGSGTSGGSNGGGGGSSDGSDSASPGTGVSNPGGGSNAGGAASGAAPGASGTALAAPGTFVSNPSSAGQGSDAAHGSSGSLAATGLIVNANGAFVSGTAVTLAPGETANVGTYTATAKGSDRTGATAGANSGSPTGSDAGSTSSTNNADPSNPSAMSDAGVHHGLSTGIIVAICVIVGVLLLLFLAFCCRRRAVAKRLRRRRTWFNAGAYDTGASEEYKDGASRSARSSFATHFDRGDAITPVSQIDLALASDEMAQVWPSNMSGSITIPAASRTIESLPSPTIRAAPDRTSLSSLSSAGSRPPSQASQYLAAPDAAAAPGSAFGADFPSPFSVRPFSPSETFSFPRPPQDDARSRASGMMTGSVVSGSIHSAAFFTAEDQHQSSEYASAAHEPAENPFLDFTEVRPVSTSASVELSTESAGSSTHFAATETIRRPFVPTMDDEMAVAPGQDVHILARFDDGWAYAELLATGTRGLIPIDTLRPVEEDLPAFLAKKRLSSYGARAEQRLSVFSGASVGKAV